ncbi:MAG: MetQ/NlpA family ABC transporter substrate-binding protein [Clostridiales bacterium]|jgi:D-methionine transport system substrate-binding protein|nr:MetQ/NlpA family ABC transporter substrate-binding protein [Clostridiales bacterium]
MKRKSIVLAALAAALTLLASSLTGCGSNATPPPATPPPAEETPLAEAPPSDELPPVAEEPSNDVPPPPDGEPKRIVVGATTVPHAEILNAAIELLAAQRITLEIKEFTDYVQPNLTLESGDLDANYFQHQPYLDDFNAENNTNIVPIAKIHYEPLGLYPGKTKSLAELADNAQVAVPNDTTNEARALLLLEVQGLIKVRPEAGLTATKADITENLKNLEIVEIEAAQLPRSLQDVDIAVINGNYAIEAGLNAATDALAKEESNSLAADTFGNVVAVRAGDESREELQALAAALQSDTIKQFINEKYQGAVIPMS